MNQNAIEVPVSWHPPELLEALAELAIGCAAVVEIGSWLGHTAIAMAKSAGVSGGRVFCVDHWRGSRNGTGRVDDPLDLYLRFWGNVQAAGLAYCIVPIFERSETAYPLFAQRPIDLLFIDGDHAYDAVYADLKNWTPLVRAGGVVCGDDYGEGGPHQAFDNYFQLALGRNVETRANGRLAMVRV